MADGEAPPAGDDDPIPCANRSSPILIHHQFPKISIPQSQTSHTDAIQHQIRSDLLDSEPYTFKPVYQHQGQPSVVFSISDKLHLLNKMNHVLVGKFSHGRPQMHSINSFFSTLKLQGNYNVSVFDHKHLFIECECKVDFDKIWLRLKWNIQGKCMRVFKWEPDFSPVKESPLAPVWVRFEGIPLYMFDEMSLRAIANSIGKPICVDPHNVHRVQVGSTRVCVELNVTKPFIDAVWVCFQDDDSNEVLDGFWVNVFYDVFPPYCLFCSHIGHSMEGCKRSKMEAVSFVPSRIHVEDGNLSSVQQVLDNLPQSGRLAPSVTFSSSKHGSKSGRAVQSRVWQPIKGKVSGALEYQGPSHVVMSHESLGSAIAEAEGKPVSSDMVQAIQYKDCQTKGIFVSGLGTAQEQAENFRDNVSAYMCDENLNQVVSIVSVGYSSLGVQQVETTSATDWEFNTHRTAYRGTASACYEGNEITPAVTQGEHTTDGLQAEVATDFSSLKHGVSIESGTCITGMDPQENAVRTPDQTAEHLRNVAVNIGTELRFSKCTESLLKDVTSLQQRIDKAGSAVIAGIGASPSSADFVNNIVSARKFFRQVGNVNCLAMADIVDFEDMQEIKGLICEQFNKEILAEGTTSVGADSITTGMPQSWAGKSQKPNGEFRKSCADLIEENDLSGLESNRRQASTIKDINQSHLKVTILPKLCFEQVSKQQSGTYKARRSTIRFAHLGTSPGIVKTTLFKLNNNRRTSRVRGQEVPFDDNG